MRFFLGLMMLIGLSLSACKPDADPAIGGWLGLWTGPEGTSLVVGRTGGEYEVIIRNLDGPRRFTAVPDPTGLRFTRDGVGETLHHGDGKATGMKWLSGKTNCLIVKAGEGFCRGSKQPR